MPLTPLGTILPHRAVLTLRGAGIRNSHQLAAAYNEGKRCCSAAQGQSPADPAAVFLPAP